MERYVLQQSNGLPVGFTGELIAEIKGPENPAPYERWHEFKLFRTKSGKYVIWIGWRSNVKKKDGTAIEPSQDDVKVCKSRDELIDYLTCDVTVEGAYDPLAYLFGFPIGVEDYAKKQRFLKDSLVDKFNSQVGDLLSQAAKEDAGFVEEI